MEGIIKNIGKTAIAIVVILLLLVGVVWYAGSYQFEQVVVTSDRLATENIDRTSSNREDVPYWIWLILPRLFPEYLPEPGIGGYVALGVTWDGGEKLPVGFSLETTNIFSFYTEGGKTLKQQPENVLEKSSSNFNLLDYRKFLLDCSNDPRFTADYLLQEIKDYYYPLSLWEKQLYRSIVIPQTHKRLLQLKDEIA
ncbi:MAG: hypothetical protein QNJ54_04020 [Prochloraceae cyanobacterium]|nr:hypothetical protein [Prochloraceae cyanobacterium]